MKIGKKSEESSLKFYQGIASLSIEALNPTVEELSSLLGREVSKVPQYLGKTDKGTDSVLLLFWCKTDLKSEVNGGISMTVPVGITLVNEARPASKSGKLQIIDKYGRSAWATPEEVQAGSIPQYANGPANISAGYHVAMPGEETLLKLIKAWVNIPDVMVYADGKWTKNTKVAPEDCEMSLDYPKLFAGDFSELKSLIKDALGYTFKCAVGVRTDDNGNQHENVYSGEFLKNGARRYEGLLQNILSSQAAGSYASTVFDGTPLHEYSPQATNFDSSSSATAEDEKKPWE